MVYRSDTVEIGHHFFLFGSDLNIWLPETSVSDAPFWCSVVSERAPAAIP
jgi:hypothetical protein